MLALCLFCHHQQAAEDNYFFYLFSWLSLQQQWSYANSYNSQRKAEVW